MTVYWRCKLCNTVISLYTLHYTTSASCLVFLLIFTQAGAVLGKKYLGEPGPSSFGRQQRLSEITIEPTNSTSGRTTVSMSSIKQLMYRNYVLHRPTKCTILHWCRHKSFNSKLKNAHWSQNWGGWARFLGPVPPSGPNIEPPLYSIPKHPWIGQSVDVLYRWIGMSSCR